VEQATVVVAAGASATVPFTIAVPADATPGDHGAGLITSLAGDADAGTVSVDRRLALRMFVRVEGELAPGIEVRDLAVRVPGGVSLKAGRASVRATIENTGNTRLVPATAVELAGPFGLGAVRVSAQVGEEILPGAVIVQEIEIEGIRPLGRTTATVAVSAETVGAGAGTAASATARASVWTVPWVALGVLALSVAAVIWWIRRRRRRGQSTIHRPVTPDPVAG
jgi:uncharacterized membrane protein